MLLANVTGFRGLGLGSMTEDRWRKSKNSLLSLEENQPNFVFSGPTCRLCPKAEENMFDQTCFKYITRRSLDDS